MKFINFGVKRSCFWYVTDFIERMLEVWNKYIDSMDLLFHMHIICLQICSRQFWAIHIFYRALYLIVTCIFRWDPSIQQTCHKWVFFYKMDLLFGQYIYFILSFVSDCYMYFSLGSIQPPNLSQLSLFIKWTYFFL